jgi:hypothetical protein
MPKGIGEPVWCADLGRVVDVRAHPCIHIRPDNRTGAESLDLEIH